MEWALRLESYTRVAEYVGMKRLSWTSSSHVSKEGGTRSLVLREGKVALTLLKETW